MHENKVQKYPLFLPEILFTFNFNFSHGSWDWSAEAAVCMGKGKKRGGGGFKNILVSYCVFKNY